MYGFFPGEKYSLRYALGDLVIKAERIIKNAFPISKGLIRPSFEVKSVPAMPYTLKRTHFDAHLGNFNYSKIPDALLWNDSIDCTFVSPSLGVIPGIDVTPASPAWMATLAEQYQAEAWESTARSFKGERFAAEFATAGDDSANSVVVDDATAGAKASTVEDPIPENAWGPIAETTDASGFVADSYADEGEL
jgi:hypothetical protein